MKGKFVAATAPPIWEFHPKEMKKASLYDGGKTGQEARILRTRRAGFERGPRTLTEHQQYPRTRQNS